MNLTYEGDPVGVSYFASALRDEGVDVTFDPPVEKRGAGSDVVVVVLTIAADRALGPVFEAAYAKATEKLKDRFPTAGVRRSDDD